MVDVERILHVSEQYGRAISAFFAARAVVAEHIDQAGYASDDEIETLCEARARLERARDAYRELSQERH
jgi:hypothetical protein